MQYRQQRAQAAATLAALAKERDELLSALESLQDSNVDKILGMSEDQIRALSVADGSHPEIDAAKCAEVIARALYRREKLLRQQAERERDEARRERDESDAVIAWCYDARTAMPQSAMADVKAAIARHRAREAGKETA